VLAGLDALLTALYVVIDKFLPARRGPGRRPVLTDAEVICPAIAQVLLDCPSEWRFLRMARRHLGHLFPVLLGQSGYNKRVRALAGQIALVLSYLARCSPSCCDNLRLLDSTPCRARGLARDRQAIGLRRLRQLRLLPQPQPLLLGLPADAAVRAPRDADRLRPVPGEHARTRRRRRDPAPHRASPRPGRNLAPR
jgi:hypothetical protein